MIEFQRFFFHNYVHTFGFERQCVAINLHKIAALADLRCKRDNCYAARAIRTVQLWLAPVVVGGDLLIGHQQTAISNSKQIVFVDIKTTMQCAQLIVSTVWFVLFCVVFPLRSKCSRSNSKGILS